MALLCDLGFIVAAIQSSGVNILGLLAWLLGIMAVPSAIQYIFIGQWHPLHLFKNN